MPPLLDEGTVREDLREGLRGAMLELSFTVSPEDGRANWVSRSRQGAGGDVLMEEGRHPSRMRVAVRL